MKTNVILLLAGLIMYEISPVISAQKQQFLVADSIVKNSCMLIADSLKQHRQTWVSYDAFQHFFDLRKVTRLNNNLISNVLLNSLDSTKTHFSADSAHVLLRLEGNKARTQRKSLSKKWGTR